MVFIGASLLILFAFLVWKEYAGYLNKGTRELEEFVRFIETMKERMECYLETPGVWVPDFTADELERLGFLESIRNGNDVNTAYAECKDLLCICNDAREILDELFSHLGNGYLDTELGIINSSLGKLTKIKDAFRTEKENKTKAMGAMIGAVAIGIIILIL